MENKKERVLAYNLATEIDREDLARISGGAMQMTTKQSIHATAVSLQSADVSYDVVADW